MHFIRVEPRNHLIMHQSNHATNRFSTARPPTQLEMAMTKNHWTMHHTCTAEDGNDVNDAAGNVLSRDDAVRSTMIEDVFGLGSFEFEVLQDWELKFMGKYVKIGTVKKPVQITEGEHHHDFHDNYSCRLIFSICQHKLAEREI